MSEGDAVPVFSEADARELVLLPAHDANKYTRGGLAMVGGCRDYPAAPIMAALASARAGAGYTRLFVPEDAADTARAHLLSIPVAPCAQAPCGALDASSVPDVLQRAAKMRALVLGPGMGHSASAVEFLKRLLDELRTAGDRRPLLFDADALNILAADPRLKASRAGRVDVLTPHEGEAARLLGRPVRDRLADARALAREFGGVVVLKGPRTLVVACDGRACCCEEGGPELAKAGTGDVLAGIIGAFLAQGLDPYDASCLGVFVHGRAGALAARELSVMSVMPEDIIDSIGSAFVSMGV